MRVKQGNRAVTASVPAPVGGWNARDALGEMEPTDAVYMTNWLPSTSDVVLRNGHTRYATGISGQVESLAAYSGAAATKLFAFAGGSIYDVTNGGAVGAASVTGLSNSRSQYINIATAAGNYVRTVNGADKSRVFDGTTWHTDGDGAPYDITGVNSINVVGINLFKNRVWLIENSSLNVWYLPTSALGGAATAFPLQGIASDGGYIVAMGTWTIDAGYGVDDLAVFVTSKGQVIVYKGTDPASATTWALVGVWKIGAPVGRRCLVKYAGDLLIICQDGLFPLSSALQSSRVNPKVALTDKILFATSNAISVYGANYGWQVFLYPKNNMLFLNVPVNTGSGQQQYVMNTITKNWCNFTGWDANCWELYNDDPYFGGNGFVGKAWNGLTDNGNNITADAKQAFNYFGAKGKYKRWTMIRPVLLSDGQPSVLANLNMDFDDYDPSSPLTYSASSYGLWDSAIWDTGLWGGGLNALKNWQGVTGVGYCAALRLKAACKGIQVHWMSSDFVMEQGGIL